MKPAMEPLDALLKRLPPGVGSEGAEHPDLGVLVAYRLNKLADQEQEALERHLVDCGECRRSLVDLSTPVSEAVRAAVRGQMESAARRPPRLAVWAAAAAGLAAGIAMFFVPSQAGSVSHALEGPEGLAPLRGEGSPTAEFAAGTPLEFVLRPLVEPSPAVSMSVFAGRTGEALRLAVGPDVRPDGVAVEASSSGAIRLRAPASTLLNLGPGAYQLLVILERSGESCAVEGAAPVEELRRRCKHALLVAERQLRLR